MMDEMVNEEINYSLGKTLGRGLPVMCSGGVAFGTFVFYKSIMERKKLGKFLFIQYAVFGSALAFVNLKRLNDYMATGH